MRLVCILLKDAKESLNQTISYNETTNNSKFS